MRLKSVLLKVQIDIFKTPGLLAEEPQGQAKISVELLGVFDGGSHKARWDRTGRGVNLRFPGDGQLSPDTIHRLALPTAININFGLSITMNVRVEIGRSAEQSEASSSGTLIKFARISFAGFGIDLSDDEQVKIRVGTSTTHNPG